MSLNLPATASDAPPTLDDGGTAEYRPGVDPDTPEFLSTLLSPPLAAGDLGTLDQFRVAGVLGRGGMGVVLRGWDPALNRAVALKVMRPEVATHPTAKARFLREARAMAALKHPHVVAIHHIGEWRGTPYLVMPLLAGESLRARLKGGALPIPDAVRFGRQIAEGLAAAHRQNLVHRDVKPDNIWLEDTPGGVQAVLLDFGLARDAAPSDVTASGAVVGTPNYMAPEQAEGGDVTPRGDLFSLGCVLYEMVSGKRAFAGENVLKYFAALTKPHVPVRTAAPGVPVALAELIDELLAKAPGDRPASADVVAARLRGMEENAATNRPNVSPSRRRFALLAGVAAVLLLAGGLYSATRNPSASAAVNNTPDAAGPLRVTAVDVKHFARTGDKDTEVGLLGRGAETPPRLHDRVQVTAHLSKPGYAYIIALRPDGTVELCSPDNETTPPPRTDTPRYPETNLDTNAYGLDEGTGLWAFAVVASETPLPAYRDWSPRAKLAWPKVNDPGRKTWWYDGQVVDVLPRTGTDRGKDAGLNLSGPAGALKSLGGVLGEAPGQSLGVVGFTVAPR